MCKSQSNVSRMTSDKSITAVDYQNQTLYPKIITSFNFKDVFKFPKPSQLEIFEISVLTF